MSNGHAGGADRFAQFLAFLVGDVDAVGEFATSHAGNVDAVGHCYGSVGNQTTHDGRETLNEKRVRYNE